MSKNVNDFSDEEAIVVICALIILVAVLAPELIKAMLLAALLYGATAALAVTFLKSPAKSPVEKATA